MFVGGCDLESMTTYLTDIGNIDKEYNTVIDGREYRTSDSYQLVNAIKLSDEIKNKLCNNLPFFSENITFCTRMFNGQYKTIVYSVVDDYIRGTYRARFNPDIYVGYAGYFDQEEWLRKYSEEDLKWLFDNFEYIGKEPSWLFEKNIRNIIENIKNANLIIINGPEIDVSDLIGIDRIKRNIEMNEIIDKVVSYYDNVFLLDMRKIIKDRSDVKNDNRHFQRHVYYKMANEFRRMLNSLMKLCNGKID